MTKRFGLAIALCLAALAHAREYARPELLVEPAELRTMLEASSTDAGPAVSVIDVRSADAYAAGAIVPSRRIDIGAWKAAFGQGDDAEGWSRRLGAVVDRPGATVVVYDEAFTPDAARTWWLFKYWGVEDVRVLNGGMNAWRGSGGPVSTGAKPVPSTSDFAAKPHPERLATRAEMLGLSKGGSAAACVLDTRSDAEVAEGVIPSAAHAEWKRFVDPATGKMRSADELAALLDRAGFDPNEPAVAYCRSGGRASVVAFAMELMGGKQVANYFGSWSDWTSDPSAPITELGATNE